MRSNFKRMLNANQHIKKASLLPGVVYVESQSDSIIVLYFDFVQFL